ncbi:MAG TPA: hypothetical protein VF846_11740 [Thermoanaerobaculia bacterium]|jgi:hypothetical protein
MPEHIKYEDDDLFNAETHHEASDVPVKGLLWAIVIFVVFGVVGHFVILFFYKSLVNVERNRMDPPQTAVPRPATADVPQNQPLLQPFPTTDAKGTPVPPQANTPVTDLIHMRAQEDVQLKNYGWVDRQHGVVHMPIETAKAVLAARLAVQGQLGTAPAPPAATTTMPVAPGSQPSPAGTPVSPDTGVAQPATTSTATSTTGGTHQ